jgi:hypothetical protein
MDVSGNLATAIGMFLHSDQPGIVNREVVLDGIMTAAPVFAPQIGGANVCNKINALRQFPRLYTAL